MMMIHDTPANRAKVALLEAALSQLLAEALRRGFFGNAAVEFAVQDGTIQHVKRRLEKIEK